MILSHRSQMFSHGPEDKQDQASIPGGAGLEGSVPGGEQPMAGRWRKGKEGKMGNAEKLGTLSWRGARSASASARVPSVNVKQSLTVPLCLFQKNNYPPGKQTWKCTKFNRMSHL